MYFDYLTKAAKNVPPFRIALIITYHIFDQQSSRNILDEIFKRIPLMKVNSLYSNPIEFCSKTNNVSFLV